MNRGEAPALKEKLAPPLLKLWGEYWVGSNPMLTIQNLRNLVKWCPVTGLNPVGVWMVNKGARLVWVKLARWCFKAETGHKTEWGMKGNTIWRALCLNWIVLALYTCSIQWSCWKLTSHILKWGAELLATSAKVVGTKFDVHNKRKRQQGKQPTWKRAREDENLNTWINFKTKIRTKIQTDCEGNIFYLR